MASDFSQISQLVPFFWSKSVQDYGWVFQLLSVACLSLATKMEETSVPPLLELQVKPESFFPQPFGLILSMSHPCVCLMPLLLHIWVFCPSVSADWEHRLHFRTGDGSKDGALRPRRAGLEAPVSYTFCVHQSFCLQGRFVRKMHKKSGLESMPNYYQCNPWYY